MTGLLKNCVGTIIVLLIELVMVPKNSTSVPKITATAPRLIMASITFALIATILPQYDLAALNG